MRGLEKLSLKTPACSLPSGRFSGREAFQHLVRNALACAAREGWTEIIVSDADFVDWPLGERAVIDSLEQWARSGRKFTMLACSYDELIRRHARFVRWRTTWDHIITCRRSPSANALDFPSALWSPAWILQRYDPEHSVGVTGSDSESLVLLRESLSEWLRSKSTPGFAATTLGL